MTRREFIARAFIAGVVATVARAAVADEDRLTAREETTHEANDALAKSFARYAKAREAIWETVCIPFGAKVTCVGCYVTPRADARGAA